MRKTERYTTQYTIIRVDEEIPPMIGMKIEAMHIYSVLTDKRTKIMHCNYIYSTVHIHIQYQKQIYNILKII